jgi:hypothetical protein
MCFSQTKSVNFDASLSPSLSLGLEDKNKVYRGSPLGDTLIKLSTILSYIKGDISMSTVNPINPFKVFSENPEGVEDTSTNNSKGGSFMSKFTKWIKDTINKVSESLKRGFEWLKSKLSPSMQKIYNLIMGELLRIEGDSNKGGWSIAAFFAGAMFTSFVLILVSSFVLGVFLTIWLIGQLIWWKIVLFAILFPIVFGLLWIWECLKCYAILIPIVALCTSWRRYYNAIVAKCTNGKWYHSVELVPVVS